MQPLISLNRVEKIFRDRVETHALSGVHLEIGAGEFVAIVGPPGCGKTTLLKILALLELPTAGQHMFAGQDVTALDANSRAWVRTQQIGLVFGEFDDDLPVYDNVELPLTYRPGKYALSAAVRRRQVTDALQRLGVMHVRKRRPPQLPDGDRQRVAIARAVVSAPVLLIIDEPVGNADVATGESIMSLLRDLHGDGMAVCLATRELRYAQYADRTVHLFAGRVVERALR